MPRQEGRARPVQKAGGPAPGRPGLRHAHSAGLDSRQRGGVLAQHGDRDYSRALGIFGEEAARGAGVPPFTYVFSAFGVRSSRVQPNGRKRRSCSPV